MNGLDLNIYMLGNKMTIEERAKEFLRLKGWRTITMYGLFDHVVELLVEFRELKNEKKSYVGVLCEDYTDFHDWRKKTFPSVTSFKSYRKFEINNEIYVAISYVTDMCSYDFDRITETKDAIHNPNYDEICDMIRAIVNDVEQCKYCKRFATHDYNGHGEYVCDYHFEKFSNEFDEDYK